MIKKILLPALFLSLCIEVSAQAKDETHPAYLDYTKSIEIRVADLVSKMTLEEKVSQMMYNSPAITRLNIPEYNWWNECLHGVARSGNASVFPEPIGLAATFDDNLVSRIGTAISDEARAMYSANLKQGFRGQYGGLTFWTPNINIFRDPRWGRGQETYGEDPYLTSVMGVALVRSLQGDNPKYLKVAACAKHFAVHSGPEKLRHEFDAKVNNKDLYETYLPAFKALVDAGVASVMCAYNATNGEACCGSDVLLKQILRDKWNFKGYLVSDCWALKDIDAGHKITKTRPESAALALHNTVDLNCGDTYKPYLIDAFKQGLVTEDEINKAVSTVFKTRFKLGMFDPEKENPYNSISADVINCEKHRNLAREAAEKSLVLLKNDKNILPLKKNTKSLFVTGPNASNIDVLMGNYYGVNNNMTTILEGIVGKVEAGCQVQYKPGIILDRTNTNPIDWTTGDAKATDAVIVVMGISGLIEGEEGEAIASEHFGDRLDYNLPPNQIGFLKKMRKDNSKPIIAVITGGSPMNLAEINELADAILLVWYPGEEGGKAVANVLFGDVSPSGKLPITFPKSLDQLPPYDDYNMTGRTYRYMKQEPIFPFGFGMSYTKFSFGKPAISNTLRNNIGEVEISVDVTNTGNVKSDEVVQLYVTAPASQGIELPLYSLKGFKRVTLASGEKKTVKFRLDTKLLESVNNAGESVLIPGTYLVNIGESSPGKRSEELGSAMAPVSEFHIRGNEQQVTLAIPSKLSGKVVSPLLFGHNLEITRKASWHGLSAEMLANRKFAAVGADGFPLHWQAVGGGLSTVTIDSTTAFTGKNSICVALTNEGRECGILSLVKDSLAIQQGRHYSIHVWVRTDAPITAIVRIRKSLDGPSLFEVRRDISPGGWKDLTAEFTAEGNEPAAFFEVVGKGSGVFNIGAVSLQDANSFHGMRRDVIECLKAMHVKLLRFPGGCFSEFYNWKDGLLPVDKRPPIGPARGREEFILHYSDGYDMHEFGIDDFMALCHELGCDASITIRMGEGSPEEASAWVEYCNGGKDNKWGQLRIARGHSEPYNVKYWSLGNEISAWGKGESPNVERYAEMCKAFSQAMRRADPTIRLIGSGMHGVHNLYPFNQAWTERILSLAAKDFDAYSYHEYIQAEDNLAQTANAPLKATMGGLEGLRTTINRREPSSQSKTIFFDEWNLWNTWERTPGIREALFSAVMLHMLCRNADSLGIEGSCYFQPVNEGAIRVMPTSAELTPVGRVFSMLTVHAGRFPVKASGEPGPCDIFASLSPDGRSLAVTAINPEEHSSHISFRIAGARVESVSTAKAYKAKSNVASSDVEGSEIEVARSAEGNYTLVLPALSFAKIEFQIVRSQ